MTRLRRFAAHAALWGFVAAAAFCGARPEAVATGFSHRSHPLAWLGASGMPDATVFNLAAFVLPGLLAAVALWSLRSVLPAQARWSARIGAQLTMLSALAFAAQGLLPLDLEDPDGTANAAHGLAWTLWWLTFAVGGLAFGVGSRGVPSLRRGLAMATTAAALAIPALALLAPIWWPNAFAQRAAFVLWFVWVAWVSSVAGDAEPINRASASGPGSSPTAGR